MGIKEVVAAPRSPWQNPYVERLIVSIRRECLDHVIILNEHHLLGVLSQYCQYHHTVRTHLSLNKDCPQPRPIKSPQDCCVPGCRWFSSSLRMSRRLSYCGDRTGRPVSAWGPFGIYNCIARMQWRQSPCILPRSQQRPMFYSTNQKSSVAIFIGKPIPRPDRFLCRIGF